MAFKHVQAEVTKLEWFTDDLCYAEFAIPQQFEFQAGQFMNIAVGGGVRRSYSLANSPVANSIAGTYVDTGAGGPGSKFFLNLQIGQTADILLPFGKFVYLPGTGDVYFFATGTGITPFLSMLLYELETLQSGRILNLIYGVRHEERIVVGDQLKELAEKHPNFHFQIFVSQPHGQWDNVGRITSAVPQIDFTVDAQVYLCGSGQMIEDMRELLQVKGVGEERIFHEKFY